MDAKQCIICFENVDVISIQEILLKQPLLKSCECVYNIHESCVVKWIRYNPTCPYCKEQLYLEHNLNPKAIGEESIRINTLTKDDIVIHLEHGNTPVIYVTNVEKNTCIRKFLMCICLIMLFLFISNILFN
jgi:hypothetical protein